MALDEQLFPKHGPAQQAQPGPQPGGQLAAIATKLKLAEGKYANLQKRNRITEDALLALERDVRAELRVLTEQLVEVRRKVQDVNLKVDAIHGELANVVQKHEFTVVERYLDLWQPLRFVTRDEAQRLIKEATRG